MDARIQIRLYTERTLSKHADHSQTRETVKSKWTDLVRCDARCMRSFRQQNHSHAQDTRTTTLHKLI